MAPPLVNAHTHVYSGLAPLGMPKPDPAPRDFVDILARVWWRLDRALDHDALRAAARLYVADALLAGTTVLIDHHESPGCIEGSLDVVADACEELGMRALVCYGATERNGGRAEARRGLAECRRFLLGNRRGLVRGAVGLHACFTVSDETIAEAGALCREFGAVLHVHLAEGTVDVEDANRRGYAGPLERLVALDALPPGSILAHGVCLSASQVAHADDRGCWLVQNPRSNRNNGVGYPAGLRASRHVALGTDGFPADMVAELRALDQTARERGDDLSAAGTRLAAGSRLAAAVLGDGLEGAADETRPAAEWAAARQEACRRHHRAGGRDIILGGRLLTADLARIRHEADVQAERLWARLARIA
jgi:cytosine/adenosine deaminase-related metal-dependent hydrolase